MIDLCACKYGDRLLMRDGRFCWYLGEFRELGECPHRIMYSEGSLGTRADNGGFFPDGEDPGDVVGIE